MEGINREMLFNSYAFLMAFLPVTWLIYFGLNRLKMFKLATGALIIASFVFYGYQDWRLCILLAASILANYILHCFFVQRKIDGTLRKVLLICGLAVNFGLLFYFKYLDFTIENINTLTGSTFALRNIALPLGISFYTFQQVSFVVDSYRGNITRYRFREYALFVSFFPQLVAGPIVLHSEIIPQFADMEKRRVDFSNLLSGVEYLTFGLAKKVLLADSFGRVCDAGYSALRSLNTLSAIAVILSYTLEIYFDFSGYCDMAMGIGKLFNIEIPMNFRSPYKAVNIDEFWKRWHITLTRFLTTYLYIPLGGNRDGKWKTYRNVLIVFTLSGLWHGADWSYVVWGILHGVMMVLYRQNKEKADKLPQWFSWLLTFFFLNVAWAFFGMESIVQPFKLFAMVLLGGVGGFTQEVVGAFCGKNLLVTLSGYFLSGHALGLFMQFLTAVWLAGGIILCVAAPSSHEIVEKKCRRQLYYLFLAIVFFSSVVRLSEVSKFIYFNF